MHANPEHFTLYKLGEFMDLGAELEVYDDRVYLMGASQIKRDTETVKLDKLEADILYLTGLVNAIKEQN